MTNTFDRRRVLNAGIIGAGLMAAPSATLAQSGETSKLMRAIEAGNAGAIKRIQEWIALPSIAAENLNMQKGANYMAALARDAGFQKVEIVPTKGHPSVFATLDAGAKRTMGIYFMYDVKQYDPAEWSSPPLEARIVDKPGWGKAIMGRGAINQKGPQATLLDTLHAFRAAGVKLPVNLVLLAEGEEEIGSPNFSDAATRPDVLAALKRCEGIIIPAAWQDKQGNVDVNLGSKGIILHRNRC